MLQRLKNLIERSGHPDDNYVPLALDMPRELHPRNTWAETARLSATSAAAVSLTTNPVNGAVAGAITGMAHRVGTEAAWDEYDKLRSEVDEKNRNRSSRY